MATLKNKWLRAISVAVLVLGLFFVVKAMERETGDKSENKVLVDQWFEYKGPNQTRAEVQKPSNYQPLTSAPGCNDGTELCSVHTTNNGSGQPVLSSAFVDQIMDAIDNETSTSNIKLEN